jgi:hypothetical protein
VRDGAQWEYISSSPYTPDARVESNKRRIAAFRKTINEIESRSLYNLRTSLKVLHHDREEKSQCPMINFEMVYEVNTGKGH